MPEARLERAIRGSLDALTSAAEALPFGPTWEEQGRIHSLGDGVSRVRGLAGARLGELVILGGRARALVLGIDVEEFYAALLDPVGKLGPGASVTGTGKAPTIPVGEAILGRVVDPLGRPMDGGESLPRLQPMPLERPAPAIHERASVHHPLHTGTLAIDAMFPIGRGQRELILGDEGTGKTALAVDALLRQRDTEVVGVYVAIGRRRSEILQIAETLRQNGGRWVVVATAADASPAMRYLAPYAGCAVGEFFSERGEHALVVYDDLSAHAVSWRELSLLMRRPPGREAYPGDIFYTHSRLLERSMQLAPERGGGSLTALPIASMESGRISAYIPTNLISITDGQIVLSQSLFASGQKPAIDASLSVSRIGSAAQPQAIRKLAGRMRLDFSSFLEVETFARLATRLEAGTERRLEVGKRIRALLRSPYGRPLGVFEEVVRLLLAQEHDLLLRIPADEVPHTAERLVHAARSRLAVLAERVDRQGTLREHEGREVVGLLSAMIDEEAEHNEPDDALAGRRETARDTPASTDEPS